MNIDQAIFLAMKIYDCVNTQFEIIDGRSNGDLMLDISSVHLTSYGERVHFNICCPQDFGIFSAIISSAHISCYAEEHEDGRIWAVLSLNYRHPGGGQNGSNIATIWIDGHCDRLIRYRREGQNPVVI